MFRTIAAVLFSCLISVSAWAQGFNGAGGGFNNTPAGVASFTVVNNITSVTNNFSIQQNAVLYTLSNNSAGTGTNLITKFTATGAQTVGTGDTTGEIVGICNSNCGGSGTFATANIAIIGQQSCVFDNGITTGDFVVVSTTTAGDCHDAGSTVPTAVQVLGVVLSATNASPGTYKVDLNPVGIMAAQTVQGNKQFVSLTGTDQKFSGGLQITSNNIGTVSAGTTTIDCGLSPLQYLTNGGAFTLAAPSNDGSCDVLTTNNGSAGTITFSGFTEGASTGDSLDTTNGHLFTIGIWRINGTSGYRVAAHQ